MRTARAYLFFLLGTALALSPRTGRAEEDRREQCIQSYESGQRLKKTGDLVEAASRLAYCANAICPARMREDCAERLQEVRAATPSLVLTVDFDGAPAAVRVSIDGQGRAWAQDATRLIVNPGRHELRVEAEGFKAQTLPILVGDGEQSVPVQIRFSSLTTEPVSTASKPADTPAKAADTPPAKAAGLPKAAIWVTASSVIGATGFVYFGLTARHREAELETQCSPSCTGSEVSEVRRDYLLANVGLGLGLASLITGGLLFLVHSEKAPASESRVVKLRVQLSPSSIGIVGAF